jgi:hypothetical protein
VLPCCSGDFRPPRLDFIQFFRRVGKVGLAPVPSSVASQGALPTPTDGSRREEFEEMFDNAVGRLLHEVVASRNHAPGHRRTASHAHRPVNGTTRVALRRSRFPAMPRSRVVRYQALLTVQSVALPLLLVGPGTELVAVTLFDLWQNGHTYPKAAGFASLLVPSIIDAKFQARPKCKIPKQCTAFSNIQPQKSPTRFNEDPSYIAGRFRSRAHGLLRGCCALCACA